MESTLGLDASKTQASPLESETFRAQQAESGLQQLGRSEWWLWLSALLVTVLSATAFVLTAIPSYFRHTEHFYEIRSDQARWGILCLLLLFNGWLAYRQWKFRRRRRELSRGDAGRNLLTGQIPESPSTDAVTGLHTRAFIEQELGKEIARATCRRICSSAPRNYFTCMRTPRKTAFLPHSHRTKTGRGSIRCAV